MQTPKNKFNGLRSYLRRMWLRWPERLAAKAEARREYKGPNKRQKWEVQCAVCKEWFKMADVEVDHIKPCGTFLSADDYKTFIPNLFCDRSNLQVLCKACHKIKTKQEQLK